MNASGRPAPKPGVSVKYRGVVARADLNNKHGTIELYLNYNVQKRDDTTTTTINKIKPSFIYLFICLVFTATLGEPLPFRLLVTIVADELA